MQARRPTTVGESQAETTRLARRLFLSPRPQRMVVPILAFAIVEAYLLVYPSLDARRVAVGAVAIALPACVAALATVPVAERLGGRMYFRRSFLLVFISLILLGSFELVAVLGYGAILWIREVILSATSNSKHLRSLPAASLHPLLGLAGLALFVPGFGPG